jgi:hypothetical protein
MIVRRVFAALACVVLLAYAGLSQAATDCSSQPCTYLPAIQRAAETPTPTATATPIPPSLICDRTAPDPVEGVQAWVTHPSPALNSIETLCIQLIRDGHLVTGVTASAVAHYKSKDTSLGPAPIGVGETQIDFDIGRATIGYTVFIDVMVGGRTITHATSFTPQ